MNKDRDLQRQVKQTLDRQVLDADTRDALHKARLQALAQAPETKIPRWLPATAVAGLVLVVAGILLDRADDSSEMPPLAADEIVLMSGDDELELFEELEFYIWLDGQEPA